MSPKFALYDPLTERWLSWSKTQGPHWKEHWKNATKWTSQYQAKLFRERNALFGVVPLKVLPKTERLSPLPLRDRPQTQAETPPHP